MIGLKRLLLLQEAPPAKNRLSELDLTNANICWHRFLPKKFGFASKVGVDLGGPVLRGSHVRCTKASKSLGLIGELIRTKKE